VEGFEGLARKGGAQIVFTARGELSMEPACNSSRMARRASSITACNWVNLAGPSLSLRRILPGWRKQLLQ
jgi:hypothetical protein